MNARFFIVYLFPFNVCFFSCVAGSQGPNDINLTKKQQLHFSDI